MRTITTRVFALALLSAPAWAAAQPQGFVSGNVEGYFATPVPEASITLVSPSGYRVSGTTDPAGRFLIGPIVDGLYELQVHAGGYLPRAIGIETSPDTTVRITVRLEPERESALTGSVRDPQGLALPGAVVEAAGPAGEVTETVSDDTGRFRFAPARPGPWSVTARIDGFVTGARETEVVFGQTADATITLALDYDVAETVVVVGSRRADQQRSVTESAVPIDVLSADVLSAQPTTDIVEVLRTLAPSFNVNTQPISDAATVVRPTNLRNLAPDHFLLLVNGKRRHRGAVITWLGNGIADGSQGPDISVIPTIAVRQVELLRDGAAAQYGSDAIAGVVNMELKDARQGGTLEIRSGSHRDINAGDRATCGPMASCMAIGNRAPRFSVAGNVGLPVGAGGFANLSLEYGEAGPTNRAVQRHDAARLVAAGGSTPRNTAQVWGSPRIENDLKTFANFGTTLASGLRPYGHANYARRRATGGFYYRHPHTRSGVFRGPVVDGLPTLLVGDRQWAETGVPQASGCPAIPVVDSAPDPVALRMVEDSPDCFTLYSRFPGGFTPQFGGDLHDHSLVAGLRSISPDGLAWDGSVTIGRSLISQFIHDTVNASLGYDTPTSFSPGEYQQDEVNFNFDVAIPVSERFHFAGGAERRTETFTIHPGDRPSWEIGPYAEQGFSSGSNGFNGYRADTTAGRWARSSIALYADGEIESPRDDTWSAGAALRYERFDDFGDTLNGKLSARRSLGGGLSARTAISTGFRAPTPGQQNTFNVTTAFIDGELVNNGVVPSTSAVALARGGRPLQPERSVNYSAGLVWERGAMSATADYFRIDVEDRLAVSNEIRLRPDEIETLLAEGIPEARNFPVFRFFLNDFSTRTEGLDLLWSWTSGPATLTAAWNHTVTDVGDLRTSVIDQFRVQTLEQGLPKTRWNVSAQYDPGPWSLLGRIHWYGSYWDSEDGRNAHALGHYQTPWSYPAYSGKALADVELSIPLRADATLAVGVQNLLNQYPDVNPFTAETVGNRYGQFSPFGFNGSYYYGRLTYRWGL
ncbi:MAG: TonB-dependent receptor [Acidobacteria bacterium]|nr:TonB-dependent receptor [Acidobacteriota bacterium]